MKPAIRNKSYNTERFPLPPVVRGPWSVVSIIFFLLLYPSDSPSAVSNRWEFTNSASYSVSDPGLIEVDEASPGYAQLILQPEEILRTEMAEYYAATSLVDVSIGQSTALRLREFGEGYELQGKFYSQAFMRELGAAWSILDCRKENDIFDSATLFGEVRLSSPGLVSLYHFNNSWVDEVSEIPLEPIDVLGWHAHAFREPMLGSHSGELFGSYAEGPMVLDGADECTFAVWLMPRFANSSWSGIVSTDWPDYLGFHMNPGPEKVYFHVSTPSGSASRSWGTLELKKWYWVVGTWEGDTGRIALYINAELVASLEASAATGALSVNDPLTVGAIQSDGSQYGYSRLDELAIWDRAFSATEVAALFADRSSVKFKVRSGNSLPLSGPFVGPDGTEDSEYNAINDSLVNGTNFNISDLYMEYEASVYSDGDGNQTPYLNSVSIELSDGSVFVDSTLGGFGQGVLNAGLTNDAEFVAAPYIGLAKQPNGGYYTNGTYTSRTLDGGPSAFWDRISWEDGRETPDDAEGLAGLWYLNGDWAPAVGGVFGNPVGVTWSDLAKMGTYSAEFNDTNSMASLPVDENLGALALWFKSEGADGGLMEIYRAAVGAIGICLTNRQVCLRGYDDGLATVYVNGSSESPVSVAGWNHLAVNFPETIAVTNVTLGKTGNSYFHGLMDDFSVYTNELLEAWINSLYTEGRREVAGKVIASVRYGGSEPLTGAFSGEYENGDVLNISDERYMQYRLILTGDGSSTPAVRDIDIGSFLEDDTGEIYQGSFDAGRTAWFGDLMGLRDKTAAGARNMHLDNDDTAELLYHMDENTWAGTGATVADSVGTRNGTRSAGKPNTSADAKVGRACGFFDGGDDFVSVPAFDLPDNFTVSIWFKSEETDPVAILSAEDAGGFYSLELNTNGVAYAPGKVSFKVNDGSGTEVVTSLRSGLNDGNWHNVAGVRDGSQIHIYIDGFREGTENIGSFGDVGSSSAYLAKIGNKSVFYEGYLDELAVWSRALTGAEIAGNAACGADTQSTGEYLCDTLVADGPSIWQYIFWTPNGVYGETLSGEDPQLEAVWHLEESAGPVTNAVGSNSGAVTGASFEEEGKFGNCLGFDGNDVITVGHTVELEPDSITVEAWVKLDEVNERVIVDKSDGSTSGYVLATDVNGNPYFSVGGSNCVSPLALYAGKWTHLAGTYDGSEIVIYMDGVPRDKTVLSGDLTGSGESLLIGRGGAGGGCEGLIDEVAIHSRALDLSEIQDHYAAGAAELKFQVRASNDPDFSGVDFAGPDGTANTYFTDWRSSYIEDATDLGSNFQFKAYFKTEDFLIEPRLHGVKVFRSNYPTTYPSVEPTEAAGFTFLGRLLGFSDKLVGGPDTEIQYQISGDSGVSPTWYFWDGTNWMADTGFGFGMSTSQDSDIDANIDSFYKQIYDKVGGNFRFKAFLRSGGEYQIKLDAVSLAASDGRVTLIAPNGTERGEKAWIAQTTNMIEWTWTGDVGNNLVLEYSLTGIDEPEWTTITTTASKGAGGSGSYPWYTPKVSLETNCYVRVRDPGDSTIEDTSDSAFTIQRLFRMISPNGGEKWYIGRTNTVSWESSYDLGSLVRIDFAQDGTNFDYMVVQAAENDNNTTNTYPWETPTGETELLSANARMQVRKPSGFPLYEDASDNPFILAGAVVTAPRGAETRVNKLEPYLIKWESIAAGSEVAIDFSADGGLNFTNLFPSVGNNDGTNSHWWTDIDQPGTDEGVIRVRSLSDSNIVGLSDFFVLADIDVTAPDGGEEWLMKTTNTITWTSGGAGDTVSLYYTVDDGGSWIEIDTGVDNDGAYEWTVSPLVSIAARVKVASELPGASNLVAVSDDVFNIAGVRVVYPNYASNTLDRGQSYWLYHDAAPESWSDARIEISYNQGTDWEYVDPDFPTWNLGDPIQFKPSYPSRQTKARVTVLNSGSYSNVNDESDEYFTVAGILVQAPTNGAKYTIGRENDVDWVSAGAAGIAEISYSPGGTNDQDFAKLTPVGGIGNNQIYPGNNNWLWSVSPLLVPSSSARIKVESGSYSHISEPFVMRGIRITDPDADTVWDVGSDQYIWWAHAGIDATARGSILLSLNGGTEFPYVLTNVYPIVDFNFLEWEMDPDYNPTTNAVLKVQVDSSIVDDDTNIVAFSDVFTLRGVKVFSPTELSNWEIGTTHDITFISAAAGASADLYYSANGGGSFDPVPIKEDFAIVDGSNSFSWTIEPFREPSTNALIKIQGTQFTGYSPVFTLGGIKVERPMQYDIWAVGQSNPIRWVSVGTDGTNTMELIYDGYPNYVITNGFDGAQLDWVVNGNAVPGGLEEVTNVVLRITDTGGYSGDSEPFKIVSEPRIEIISPDAGDFWKVAQTKKIEWLKGGLMEAGDFEVYTYYGDGFGIVDQVLNTVEFSESNNVFSVDWFVPNDALGPTKIFVYNTNSPSVSRTSEVFNVVGNFDMIYPNGGESEIYALNENVQVSWGRRGSVRLFDMYYKVATNEWVKINDDPIYKSGGGLSEDYPVAPWVPPDVRSDEVYFRIQDAAYTNIFPGVGGVGPYDDSDEAFSINYYTITWNVYDANTTSQLDKISFSDSFLGSEVGETSPITRYYPYGNFDTVFYREYFKDRVVFNWLSEPSRTIDVPMTETDIEPDYHVLADFYYDPVTNSLTIHSWLEKGGRVLENPESCNVRVFDSTGTQVATRTPAMLNGGVFRDTWENVDDSLQIGQTYFARVEITYSLTVYSSAVTFSIRLAAGMEEAQAILTAVSESKTDILSDLSKVGSNLTAFAASATGSLATIKSDTGAIKTDVGTIQTDIGDIETDIGGIQTDIGDIEGELGSMSTNLTSGMSALTSQVVRVIGPGVSNLLGMVTNIYDSADSDLARILTRPTTVALGSTNTILYKTRDYDESGVFIEVPDASPPVLAQMNKVISGIFSYSLVVSNSWGTGSFMVTCRDPRASDRMILDVVTETESGTDLAVKQLTNDVAEVEGMVTNIQEVVAQVRTLVQAMDGSGIGSRITEIDAAVSNLTTTVASADLPSMRTTMEDLRTAVEGVEGVDLSGVEAGLEEVRTSVEGMGDVDLSEVTGAIDDLETRIGAPQDSSVSDTFFGRLNALSDQLDSLGGTSSEASDSAQQAKTQAAAAASAVQTLRGLIEEGRLSESAEAIAQIRNALSDVRNRVSDIPEEFPIGGMNEQIRRIAGRIEQIAAARGIEYRVPLEGVPEGEGGAGEGIEGAAGVGGEAGVPGESAQESVQALNRNIEEIKGSMTFMGKLIDELRYEPVVEETLIGVE